MIRCHNLTYCYHNAPAPALRDVAFHLPAGTLTCLAGPNGSGKSTLMLLMAGLLDTPAAASLTLGGAVTLLPHDPDAWLLGNTVLEDLWLGLPPHSPARQQAMDLARRFDLAELLDSPTRHLSFGQKRKLTLASALSANPPLLLLDEPLSGLDYPSIRELRTILTHEKQAGRTLVISSHDLEPLLDLADTVLLLHQGTVAAHLPVSEALPRMAACGVRPPCSWTLDKRLAPWE